MESFEESGILVTQTKVSLQSTDFATQLLKIKDQYECLVELIETMESAKFTIKKAVQVIQELDFGEDICGISRYIQKRMQNNAISKIMNIKRPGISPAVYSLLKHSQITTTSVERSFSMLRKLLAKDRKFKVKNVQQYMISHFNSCTW